MHGFFMSHHYSPELISEAILCFKEEDGIDISEETAEEYLNGLSGLFLAFARPNLKGGEETQVNPPRISSMGASNTHGTLQFATKRL